MSFIYLVFIASAFAQTFETNQTNLIKPQQYSQLLINPIRMFSHEFDPGVMSFQINIDPHAKPIDIVYFTSANSSYYLCYMGSITYKMFPHSCFDKIEKHDCEQCGNQLSAAIKESITSETKQRSRVDRICLNCSQQINITIDNLKLYDIKTTSPVILFDNTMTNTTSVNLTISSKIQLVTDKTNYHEMLILIFVFIIMTTILTIFVCIMNHKYKKAKDRSFNSSLISEEKKSRMKDH